MTYPGIKSRIKSDGSIVYDFRVDIRMPRCSDFCATYSHANIIIDIAQKIKHDPSLKEKINGRLLSMFKDGLELTKRYAYPDLGSNTIERQFIQQAVAAYKRDGKVFDQDTNRHQLTFDELFHYIFWICMQEDINYPMPVQRGRRLSYARYVEAVWYQDNGYSLESVISRAISHSQPVNWKGLVYPDIV